ncbi:MAG: TIGR00341 family protein [Desulfurivibrio sp.]|nr:TIGR00341 family protein [Desulfurivibrio sp.]MBU3936445.1 TIGR00341 family protein [Pseudomonadota bacterium]MBU4119150.1 TIGR00341 family protein [Pseudomonadota bacterium]
MQLVEVIAHPENLEKLPAIVADLKIEKFWPAGGTAELAVYHLLVEQEKIQGLLDALQGILGPDGNIVLITPEAVLPHHAPSEEELKKSSRETTREELYEEVEKGARLGSNFLLLVALSTVVASIGLIKDNVAVVIGAMVIAPLLGPNIALALSTALGDTKLLWTAAKSNIAGLGLAIGIGICEGFFWPVSFASHELLARTDVGLDSIVLALASGAAAALSLTTGLSSVLVGVMVAVALLPPAAALGLMLGSGQMDLAIGAGLLLSVNIACVNLSAKLVFIFKGIKPRTWLSGEKARESSTVYLLIWIISLGVLTAIILAMKKG